MSIKNTCRSCPWTIIRLVNFSRLSIASINGKQHLSEVVYSALVGFGSGTYRYTKDSQDMLVSRNNDLDFMNTIFILPVVLYGCETWSLTLREECRLRIFENMILRRIIGPKRDENGEWRRLHNEEIHSFYLSPNIARVIKSRRLRWAGNVA